MPDPRPAPAPERRREHWQGIYGKHAVDEVSWYQERPASSLALVRGAAAPPGAAVIDVGGGASRLVDGLLEAGYRHVAVLDVSETALGRARARLGERAARVEWIAADVTRWRPSRRYDVWHDRALFHFLVDPADRAAYREALAAAVPAGGHVIIGTFALDGPERCSDLPVVRYDAASLQAELGAGYGLVETLAESHHTPAGKVQRFQFSRFERR
jgi:SAM-dependent methyltransferase